MMFKTLLLVGVAILVALPASAEKQYAPGVSDTEIKIGNTRHTATSICDWDDC